MEKHAFNIAIDGPAGAGKSTIAKLVAKKLDCIYVDTGAMYRAIALYLLRSGVDTADEAAVSEAVKNADITICYRDGAQQVILNGEDVSGLIRTEEVGNTASAVSVYPAVRAHLLELQRSLAASQIYLTASSRVRAMRRYKELTEKGTMCNLEEIEQDIIERDHRDMTRETAPLKQAEDAVLLDSSEMTLEQVVQAIIDTAKARGLKEEA